MSTAQESNVTAQELADFMNTGWPQPEADWYYDDKNDDLWEQTLQMDPANPERHVAVEPAKLINLNDFEASILYQGQGENFSDWFWDVEQQKVVLQESPSGELTGIVGDLAGNSAGDFSNLTSLIFDAQFFGQSFDHEQVHRL